MFMKQLFQEIGIELEVRNLLTDYTLADGTRAHVAHQMIANGATCTDAELIQQVKDALPPKSRIACIVEIFGEYGVAELTALANTGKILETKSRWLYRDMDLLMEYIKEFVHEKLT